MALLAESRAAVGAQAAAAASAPAASASSSPSPPQQHRVAWLIGEASYAPGSGLNALPNASKDAEEVGKILADHCGFKTSIVTDAPKSALECFSRSLFVQSLDGQSDSVFLLYFAGHGYSCNGQTYLVPTDGTSADPTSWVNLNDLLRPLHDSVGGATGPMARAAKSCSAKPAPHCLILVVLDSCRELPLEEVRKDCRLAALTDAKPYNAVNTELCILRACDEGKTAKESEDAQHGVFTQAFIGALKEPGMSWGAIWQKCRVDCNKASKGKQRPWRSDTSSKADSLVLHSAARKQLVVPLGQQEVLGKRTEAVQEMELEEQPTELLTVGDAARTLVWEGRNWKGSLLFNRILWRGLFLVLVFLAIFDLAWRCIDEVDAHAGGAVGPAAPDATEPAGEGKVPAAVTSQQDTVKKSSMVRPVKAQDAAVAETKDLFAAGEGSAHLQDFLASAHRHNRPAYVNCTKNFTSCAIATCSESLGIHFLAKDEFQDEDLEDRLLDLLKPCLQINTVCSVSVAGIIDAKNGFRGWQSPVPALQVEEDFFTAEIDDDDVRDALPAWSFGFWTGISARVAVCHLAGEVLQGSNGGEAAAVGQAAHAAVAASTPVTSREERTLHAHGRRDVYMKKWMIHQQAFVLHDWSQCSFSGTCAMTTCALTPDFGSWGNSTHDTDDDDKEFGLVPWSCFDGTMTCSIRATVCDAENSGHEESGFCASVEMALTWEVFKLLSHDEGDGGLTSIRVAGCEHVGHPGTPLV